MFFKNWPIFAYINCISRLFSFVKTFWVFNENVLYLQINVSLLLQSSDSRLSMLFVGSLSFLQFRLLHILLGSFSGAILFWLLLWTESFYYALCPSLILAVLKSSNLLIYYFCFHHSSGIAYYNCYVLPTNAILQTVMLVNPQSCS